MQSGLAAARCAMQEDPPAPDMNPLVAPATDPPKEATPLAEASNVGPARQARAAAPLQLPAHCAGRGSVGVVRGAALMI